MNIMNIFLLILFVCCVSSETTQTSESTTGTTNDLKEELSRNAEQLFVRIRAVIVKLQVEKREHLAVTLSREEWNLKLVYNELLNSSPDTARLAFLEAELIRLEYRITKEISIIERDTLEQEVLLSITKALKKWAEQEMKILAVQNNIRAREAYLELQHEVTMLNSFIGELTRAKDLQTMEKTEAALRGIETRIYETLRRFGFNGINTTPVPIEDAQVKSLSTPLPVQMKDILLKNAVELQTYVKSKTIELQKQNWTADTKGLMIIEYEIQLLEFKILRSSDKYVRLFESELYWLERNLAVEVEFLAKNEKKKEQVLTLIVALKERIESAIKIMNQSFISKELEDDNRRIDILLTNVKNTDDSKSLEVMEKELRQLIKIVNDQFNRFSLDI